MDIIPGLPRDEWGYSTPMVDLGVNVWNGTFLYPKGGENGTIIAPNQEIPIDNASAEYVAGRLTELEQVSNSLARRYKLLGATAFPSLTLAMKRKLFQD